MKYKLLGSKYFPHVIALSAFLFSASIAHASPIQWDEPGISGSHDDFKRAAISNSWEVMAVTKRSPHDFDISDHFAASSIGQYPSASEQRGISEHLSAVPEPESYAMLMAGLSLMGFIAHRRNKKTHG
jgi:hypothetical protein